MRIKKKLFGILFSFILVLGMSITAFAEEKAISVGTIYSIDDVIGLGSLSEYWVITDDSGNQPTRIFALSANVPQPDYSFDKGQFEFSNLFAEGTSLYLGHDQNLIGDENVIGIKCISGDGTQSNPYKFRLVIKYPVWVGGVQVTSENKDYLEGGKVTYTPADPENSAKLTLNSADINGTIDPNAYGVVFLPAIYAEDKDLIIVAEGTNTVTGPNVSNDYEGIYSPCSYGINVVKGSLIVTGSGTLTAKGGNAMKNGETTVDLGSSIGVFAGDGVAINGTLTAKGGTANKSCGVSSENGNITVKAGGTLTATGDKAGEHSDGVSSENGNVIVEASGALTATGGTAAKNGWSNGVILSKGNATVNGTLTATGGKSTDRESYGVSAKNGVTVNGVLKATGGPASAGSYGIQVYNDVTVEKDGTLEAAGDTVTSTSTGNNSIGVDIEQGDVTVNGTLIATGSKAGYSSYGVSAKGGVTVNGTLTATSDEAKEDSRGVAAYDITVNGVLKATSGEARDDSIGVSASNGCVTVNGTLEATGGVATSSGYSYGVSAQNGVTVKGKLTANATGGTETSNSYGVFSGGNVTVETSGTLDATSGEAWYDSIGVSASNGCVTVNGTLTATGKGYAISGTVKNSVAGTGWTNTEGTEGEAAIKVSAEGQMLDYKKVQFPENKKPATVITAPTGKTLTYNGKAQTGVKAGTGYKLSGTVSATNAGSYKAMATLKNGYIWSDKTTAAKTIGWKIKKAEKKIKIPTVKKLTYNSKSQTALKSGDHYTVSGTTKAKKAGTYNATVKLKTDANYTFKWSDGKTGAKTIKWTIAKAANPLKIKAKTATVLYKKLKKEKQNVAVSKVINFQKKGQGKMSYTKKSGNGKITINKNSGKVTVKKGLDKGTYKVTVSVKAKGNDNYKASSVKKVTFKIIVK